MSLASAPLWPSNTAAIPTKTSLAPLFPASDHRAAWEKRKLSKLREKRCIIPGKGMRRSRAHRRRSSWYLRRPWREAVWQRASPVREREGRFQRGHLGDWNTAGAPPCLYTVKHVEDSPPQWPQKEKKKKKAMMNTRLDLTLAVIFLLRTWFNGTYDWI